MIKLSVNHEELRFIVSAVKQLLAKGEKYSEKLAVKYPGSDASKFVADKQYRMQETLQYLEKELWGKEL